MDITHKRFNRVDLLTLVGRLDAASADQLQEQIDGLLAQGHSRIVLDMAALEYLSSPGLRVLVESLKRARDPKITNPRGGDVRIAGPQPRIVDVFDLTGLTPLFQIYGDAIEAVGSF